MDLPLSHNPPHQATQQQRYPKAHSPHQAHAEAQLSPSISWLAEAAVFSSFQLQDIARILLGAAQHLRYPRYQLC